MILGREWVTWGDIVVYGHTSHRPRSLKSVMHRIATSHDAWQFRTISHPASTNSTSPDQHSVGHHPEDAEKGRHPFCTGVVGDVFATLVMIAFHEPTGHSPHRPPDCRVREPVSRGDPGESPVTSLVFHLLYGIGGGVGFSLAFGSLVDDADKPETVGLVAGVIYPIALSAFGERVVLGRLLDVDLSTDERVVFHADHVVYDFALGAWAGSHS